MVEASRPYGWHCQVGQQEPLVLGGEPLRRPNERLGRLTFRLAKFSPSEEQPYSVLIIPNEAEARPCSLPVAECTSTCTFAAFPVMHWYNALIC